MDWFTESHTRVVFFSSCSFDFMLFSNIFFNWIFRCIPQIGDLMCWQLGCRCYEVFDQSEEENWIQKAQIAAPQQRNIRERQHQPELRDYWQHITPTRKADLLCLECFRKPHTLFSSRLAGIACNFNPLTSYSPQAASLINWSIQRASQIGEFLGIFRPLRPMKLILVVSWLALNTAFPWFPPILFSSSCSWNLRRVCISQFAH